jgi:hypothetical protein
MVAEVRPDYVTEWTAMKAVASGLWQHDREGNRHQPGQLVHHSDAGRSTPLSPLLNNVSERESRLPPDRSATRTTTR